MKMSLLAVHTKGTVESTMYNARDSDNKSFERKEIGEKFFFSIRERS